MAKCEECFSFRSCQAWCVVIDKLLQTNRAREELQKDDAESCPSFKNKADVQEVKHGEWQEERWCDNFQHTCSLCHRTVRVHPQSVAYRYCPYCGAKMDKRSADNG